MVFEKKKLGYILINEGLITEEQLNEALKAQKVLGKKIGEVLVKQKIVNEEQIIKAIEIQTGISKIDLNTVEFDKNAIGIISRKLCEKYIVIPFAFENNRLKAAFSDPLNMSAISEVETSAGFEIERYIAKKDDIKNYINVHYSRQPGSEASMEFFKENPEKKASIISLEYNEEINNSPIVKRVEWLLKNAIDMRAAEIHMEPLGNEMRIRYRIDGRLQDINKFEIDSYDSMVTRIKILAGLDIAEKREMQEGKIIFRYDQEKPYADLMISILPVINGEKIFIRISTNSINNITKHELGMTEENLKKLDNIISNSNGIILFTGPADSGKSTSLYAFLKELNKDSVSIIAIEELIENNLPGINQVNAKAGVTFSKSLRNALKQRPDIIMIDEIRDNEVAEIAAKAAAQHLVLSTLSTNYSSASIIGFLDMGIKPFLISNSVIGVISQRLVRKICPKCGEEYEADDREKKILNWGTNKSLTLRRGKGCAFCNGTGYRGRIGIYEIMEITKAHRKVLNSGASLDTLKDISIANGMTTLEEECKEIILQGITTIDELAAITLS